MANDDIKPAAVMYYSSTRPAIEGMENHKALLLTFVSDSDTFYEINCYGTGNYKPNTLVKGFKNVTVLIDPDSGKVIDITEYNYFYQYIMGSNNIVWARTFGDLIPFN